MLTSLRQVDEAFQLKLQGLMLDAVNPETQELEPKEVPVIYIDPEMEFKDKVYPAIVFYRAGAYPDLTRWTNDKFYDNVQTGADGNPVKVDVRDAPLPYNIYYGIRLYYTYQSDGVEMNTFILTQLKRGCYLPIDGEEYDVEFVSYKNPNSTYRQFGEIKATDDRETVDQYLFKVLMELDTATRQTVNVSQQIVITANNTQ